MNIEHMIIVYHSWKRKLFVVATQGIKLVLLPNAGARTEEPDGSSFTALRPPVSAQPHQLLTRVLRSAPVQPSAASLSTPPPRAGKLILSLSEKTLTSFIAPVRPTCLVMLHLNVYYFGPNKHICYSSISILHCFSEVVAGISLRFSNCDKDKHTCIEYTEKSFCILIKDMEQHTI